MTALTHSSQHAAIPVLSATGSPDVPVTATTAHTTSEPTWWATLTPAQGAVIGGAFTFAAAVVGVLLGWWLLSGKVKDLKGAVDKSDELLRGHSENVDKVLREVGEKLTGLDAQIVSATESLGQLRGDVGDLQSTTLPDLPDAANGAATASRDAVREAWASIRDKLEEIAAQTTDGRTRAKYGRIDRRNYVDLIAALNFDGKLGGDARSYSRAAEIWSKYRNGKRVATNNDQNEIISIKQELLSR